MSSEFIIKVLRAVVWFELYFLSFLFLKKLWEKL